jgi:hypothetical protein
LLLLACLLILDSPVWMTLVLPIVAYAGSWLALGSGPLRLKTMRIRRVARRPDQLAMCRCLAEELRLIRDASSDSDISDQLGRMLLVINRSLDVLVEEGWKSDAERLNRAMESTGGLMNAYLRVERRGFGSAEERSRVLEDLATLELALDDAWFRINREAIVGLKTLSATLDLTIGYERP